ncbi:MAG TPA: hypothetical protein VLH35_01265 [Candidatus Acidoferrales bacterium]|nr:hypothetical protein [Candidatus Acidoferrales bacterium]
MNKWLAVLTISLCLLVSVPFVAALQVGQEGAVFALPEENGNVIFVSGASYSETGAAYLVGNYSEGQFYAWYFPMFSMGNGTTNLRLSAQDCNVTIISFKSQENVIEDNLFNRTKLLDCTVNGEGTIKIDFGMVTNQTTTVYLDGTQKPQGSGWSYTDFGVTVTAPVSDLAICTQYTDFVPPRIAPHTNPLTYVGIIIGLIVAVLIIFGMTEFKGYRNKQKTDNKT